MCIIWIQLGICIVQFYHSSPPSSQLSPGVKRLEIKPKILWHFTPFLTRFSCFPLPPLSSFLLPPLSSFPFFSPIGRSSYIELSILLYLSLLPLVQWRGKHVRLYIYWISRFQYNNRNNPLASMRHCPHCPPHVGLEGNQPVCGSR